MDVWNLKGGKYKILNDDQIEEMHLASLKLLEETGIVFEEDEALKKFEENGCKVDYAKNRVWLPAALVKQCLALTPDRITLAARNPKYDLQLEKNRVYFGPGTQALYVLDIETGEKRWVNEQDIYDYPRFIDALEYQHFFKTCVYPRELPSAITDVYQTYAAFKNCTKAIGIAAFSPESALDAIMMAEALAGGKDELAKRPYIVMNVLSSSPLQWANTNLKILKLCAEHRVPLIIGSEPQCGSTGPVTLVGSIVMGNAENIAAITLAQLYSPGTPVIYGQVGSISDLKTGYFASGAVELGIMNAMAIQLAHSYNIPTYSTGGMSDSKTTDVQAGYEKALQLLTVALAGGNYIHDSAGLLECCMTASFEQYVVDNEICGMVARVLQEITITPESLALDVINSVGPGGHFFAHEHTFDLFRKEHYIPTIADRSMRFDWEARGSKDNAQVAKEKARKILKNHHPEQLPDNVDAEMRKILENAKKRV